MGDLTQGLIIGAIVCVVGLGLIDALAWVVSHIDIAWS